MDKILISHRLRMVAQLCKNSKTVADIGTDHGYLPIYLVQNHICDRAIACDVRKKPLERAREHVRLYGLSEKIELRLSDGLNKLLEDEADTITICGMGGKLITKILEEGRDKLKSNTRLILSPQSEIPEFREYLLGNGFTIDDEHMLMEDEKYYVIIETHLQGEWRELLRNINQTSLRYGRKLLNKKSAVLLQYLLKEKKAKEQLIYNIEKSDGSRALIEIRLEELRRDISIIDDALSFYDDTKTL